MMKPKTFRLIFVLSVIFSIIVVELLGLHTYAMYAVRGLFVYFFVVAAIMYTVYLIRKTSKRRNLRRLVRKYDRYGFNKVQAIGRIKRDISKTDYFKPYFFDKPYYDHKS